MRKLLLVIGLSVLVSACGSSNNNTSTPLEACQSLVSTLCNKIFQCFPTQAAQLYANAAACTTAVEATTCTAANTTCPTGKTFSSSQASTCINDTAAEACPTSIDNATTPASCDTVCQ